MITSKDELEKLGHDSYIINIAKTMGKRGKLNAIKFSSRKLGKNCEHIPRCYLSKKPFTFMQG